MDPDGAQAILADYDRRHDAYDSFTQAVHRLITDDLLQAAGLRVHTITSRTKERDSLEGKLNKPDRDYRWLTDITDLSGVRIITLFHDDVDRIAPLIEQQFDVDAANSSDKRKLLDPDRFGYLSLHFVVSLSPSRLALPEYERFGGMKAELQLRSILQHAWAEIEHALGYKAKEEIPREARRRFSRLAGLLEVGDTEFAGIRDYLKEYRAAVVEAVTEGSAGVAIDGPALDAYFRTDAAAVALDAQLAAILGAQVVEGLSYNHILSVSLPRFGIETIEQLRAALGEHRDIMAGYVEAAHERRFYGDVRMVGHGYAGLVLCYVLAARNRVAAEVVAWLTLVGIGGVDDRPATALAMVDMYRQATIRRGA